MVKRYNKSIFTVNLIFICICLLLLSVVGVLVFILPHEDFSEQENRALADIPRFTPSSFWDGRYFGGISDFYSDRIPFRTQMIRAKAMCELALGREQNNGVIFSEGGALIDRCEYKSDAILRKNAEKIKNFISEYPSANTVCVPRSVDVLANSESARSALDLLEREGLFDEALLSELKAGAEKGEEVYYKTDHHLDADGAFSLYRYVVSALGYKPYEKSDFTVTEVSDGFLGTIYSKSGLLSKSADTVSLYRYDGDADFCVKCEDMGCETQALYCFNCLENKDKYGVFLGGNHGIARVSDGSRDKPSLLLIKDSFANAIIPLLARHFDLTVYDPRYSDVRADELDPEKFDEVLILFGVDTIATTALDF